MQQPGACLLTVFPNLDRSHTIGHLLALLGYEVIGAYDTHAADLLATHLRPAALLVDASLAPEDTLRRLHTSAPKAPVLVIDTATDALAAERWLAAGAAAYCSTLPDCDALERALGRLCPVHQPAPRLGPWAVVGLLDALTAHDQAAARHARRVAALTISLGRRLELDRVTVQQAGWGALLHEVGRLALPHASLDVVRELTAQHLTSQPLTPREQHMLAQLPRMALQVVGALPLGPLTHTIIGAPLGCPGISMLLPGAAPLAQRIVAIVDAYDTLTCAPTSLPPDVALAHLELRCSWGAAVIVSLRTAIAAEEAARPCMRAVGKPESSAA
jgi:hypothetical protein